MTTHFFYVGDIVEVDGARGEVVGRVRNREYDIIESVTVRFLDGTIQGFDESEFTDIDIVPEAAK